MKEINTSVKKSFVKKIFIKICRLFGYEIIDQSNFSVPSQNKSLNDNLNIHGSKSITLPLGEVKVTRKINALTVIFRSCTSVKMLTQSKERLFNKDKNEYTFRSLHSIISSLHQAKENFPGIKFNIIVIDHNSSENDLKKIKNQLDNSKFENLILSLDVNEFKNEITKINAENKEVTQNQISNMSNIHKSFIIAKKQCKDLIYFVEDDYLHKIDAISEMIYAYERISSQIGKELILCPIDYPYLYSKVDNTNIFLGATKHWRAIGETLVTFFTSVDMLHKHWDKFTSMCKYEHYPFEKPLHEIYKTEWCLSPIPSLAFHCTNINSIYGLSPTLDWKKIWEDNKNY